MDCCCDAELLWLAPVTKDTELGPEEEVLWAEPLEWVQVGAEVDWREVVVTRVDPVEALPVGPPTDEPLARLEKMLLLEGPELPLPVDNAGSVLVTVARDEEPPIEPVPKLEDGR